MEYSVCSVGLRMSSSVVSAEVCLAGNSGYSSVAGGRSNPFASPRRWSQVPFSTMTAIGALLAAAPALAQSPTGGNVVAGSAGISQAGAVTTINQSSQNAIINWRAFSIGPYATVNFNQPNSSAATLNRVTGHEASIISGALNANGRVFIVNSAGV